MARTTPAMMTPTPRSWTSEGSSARSRIPKITDRAGWRVKVTDVRAAGRRGSAHAIRSQPATCEVRASVTSQACSGQDGSRRSSPSAAPTGRLTIVAESVA
ncbi:MAG TPA: hypothetical protein VH650_05690 [Gaiellaceae bacterium]